MVEETRSGSLTKAGKEHIDSNDLLCAELPTPDWMIVFDDADMKPEVFTDHFAAQKRFKALANNWSCHLFQRVEST